MIKYIVKLYLIITITLFVQPGCSFETLIRQCDPITSQPLHDNSNPTVKFLIPNEREIRQEKQSASVSSFEGSRKIAFATGAPGEPITPTQLHFKPSRLKWKRKPLISTRQLEAKRDKKRAKKGDNNA